MTNLLQVLEDSSDIFDVLPKYQRDTIEALLKQGKSNEEVAEIWLAANGPSNTFPFGAENKKNTFLDKLEKELQDFICNEEKYIEERKQILEHCKAGSLVGITSLTAFIAPIIGTAPSLILPVIVLILTSAFKIGINAWCSFKAEENEVVVSEENRN